MNKASNKMYYYFGVTERRKCKDCLNFIKAYREGKGIIGKCRLYGVTSSSRSDWGASRMACGRFNCPDAYPTPVIRWQKVKALEKE